ncbi:MAG: hypothetical protein ABI859_12140 [Pseudomonadota bacterium]
MKSWVIAAIGCAAALTAVVHAETIVIDDQVQLRASAVDKPTRGSSMQAVESHFGAPAAKHAAVGNPPISRWDYPGFSVFFEHSIVLHSVATAP